ncbi:hypothetical protein GcM1_191026 [Golovinomyces cichoracearum]|uniref:Uncharacterized protein n=1 Tax=Golovinomyces cichoracearum TaxID=62708 RepID=A0A420J1E2_9PEZI|nr:hypothetical protein GcM1_191026 [Golovinomyces cichoracearum]
MNPARYANLGRIQKQVVTSHQRLSGELKPFHVVLVNRWHSLLSIAPQHNKTWYQDRLREEFRERNEAQGWLEQISETSDIFYNITRAHHDGFPIGRLPGFKPSHLPIYVYMIGKYTLRWAFYRIAARLCDSPHKNIREVINPHKDHKLEKIAVRYDMDRSEFKAVTHQLRRFWPLLY